MCYVGKAESDKDYTYQYKVFKTLQGENDSLKLLYIDSVLNNPNKYIPPVIFELSRILFNTGKKDEASYWFYLAQLRARYDANLCLDVTARQAVTILNNYYGPEINKYAIQDLKKLEKIVEKVVKFVSTNKENYEHTWLNTHGLDAMAKFFNKESAPKETTEPKSKWDSIKKKTIEDYYNGFIKYAKIKK